MQVIDGGRDKLIEEFGRLILDTFGQKDEGVYQRMSEISHALDRRKDHLSVVCEPEAQRAK